MHKRREGGPPKNCTLFGWLVLACLCALPPFASAQQPTGQTLEERSNPQQTAAADTIVAVEVTGNTTVDADLIRRGFGLRPGDRYSADAVRRGLRRLIDLGFFGDIVVEGTTAPEGLTLILRVTETPRIGAVEFIGLEHIKEEKLLELTGPLVGVLADERLLANLERRLRQSYDSKGYTRMTMSSRFLPGDSESRRILYVEIEEGPRMRVEEIRFKGLATVDPGDLRSSMDQGVKGFPFKKGIYKPHQMEGDPERIEEKLAALGYRDGKVNGYELLPGSRDERLVIEIDVDEGPLYSFGDLNFEGNEKLPSVVLYGISKIKPYETYNQQKIEETIQEIYGVYADAGYLRVAVVPDYDVVDSTVVNVSFRVIEGNPSHIRDIVITGNTRTKEKVIRRQLALRPGTLFRRNALIRGQRELFQLGLFSNIVPETRPVPGSDDFDLVLNVEERQVGTASAGFGFSSAVGLTGFLELGHPNLFGNGQSANLRVERGTLRNNAELSFTEPWFRGTPTSVGFDLFTTTATRRTRSLDARIRRTGGAVRLGRQLPIPYTRIFGTYRLENQTTIDETTLEDNLIDTGFRFNETDQLVSTLSITLRRNSTDHYLYPTTGSVATLRAEASGGFLGGDRVFQKYDIDIRKYLPTVRAGGWKPILMLRPRFGAVGELFRDDPLEGAYTPEDQIPNYAISDTLRNAGGRGAAIYIPVPKLYREFQPETVELFRLGGTTYNALRGYEDDEIAPRGNTTPRNLVSSIENSSGDVIGYSVGRDSFSWPGGRYLMTFTAELQFPIADPLHALLFAETGGVWNDLSDVQARDFRRAAGFGFRMEIPMLGLVGFDYAYGFDRFVTSTQSYTGGGWEPHIQFGRTF